MQDDLQAAVRKHQMGLLDEAARVYEHLIADNPRHAVAMNLLGAVAHQKQDYHRAQILIEGAIAITPQDASFHSNLAEVYRALGNPDRAVECCRTALRLDPNAHGAANNLGLALQQIGRLDSAMESFRKAIELRPDFALAHNNLGIAMRLAGCFDEAIHEFRAALADDPYLPMAHSNLGQMLLERYQRQEALVHCRQAVQLQPGLPEAHNNLGNVLREMGRLDEAHACYSEALRLNPHLALTCNNIGQAFQEEAKFDQALDWYRRALQRDSKSARIHVNLASLLQELEQIPDAIFHYQQAIAIDSQFPDAHHGFGWILHDQGKFDEALGSYHEALRIRPDFVMALCSLGTLLQEMGNLDESESHFRRAIQADPDHAGAHAGLAILLGAKLPDDDLAAIRRISTNPNLTDAKRSSVYFGLAQVHDGRKDYALAGDYLLRANALENSNTVKRGQEYDPAHHDKLVSGIIATFTPEWFSKVKSFGLPSERPVFIIGLPRSGTTLTEQILASHSRVFGAGELRLAGTIFQSLPKVMNQSSPPWDCLRALDENTVKGLANSYLQELVSLDATSLRIVDKMPDNYLYLGLIVALFPQARIIHCRRELRDTAVSCWMTNFRQIRWANRFEHIASRFHAYRRLIEHWQEVLPVPILSVDYEHTVAEVETTARRLIDWCGLEWEPACTAFHKKDRPVRTASVTQVRQPVYRSSVARWKNYLETLNPLFSLLPE